MPDRIDDPDPEPRGRLFEHGPKAERTEESDNPPATREGGHGIPARLADALAGLAPERVRDMADAVVLHKMFPAWAVWLPEGSRPWTAARPASGSAPGPGLPMIWIGRNTAVDLAARMRDVDAQLPGSDRG
jgi:hypothetical protein